MNPFSQEALNAAVVKSLLEDPPEVGKRRIRFSVTLPDGTVEIHYVRRNVGGHVAIGVSVMDLLKRPGVRVTGEWVF